MHVLLDEEMGLFFSFRTIFLFPCLPMSPVARRNGELFTMINSGVLSYEITNSISEQYVRVPPCSSHGTSRPFRYIFHHLWGPI